MVTINVTNVDEDPKLTGPASARVAENTDITVPIATTAYAATDDEDGVGDGAVVMTLSGADADVFSIDGGAVKFKAVPNFEAPKDAGKDNVYNITVVATDSDVQTDEMDVTVTVTNVDEGGTVTLSTLQPRIGTALTATLTDIDGAVSDVKWQWAKSDNGVGDSYTDIAEATASSYTPVAADDGAFLRATAPRYTDPQGSGKTAVSDASTNEVEIDDTNRAPEFLDQDLKMDGDQTDQDREIEENTGAGMDVGDGLTGTVPVTATDPNDDNLTYTLGGTDGASFSILRNTGQLQTKAALNREEKDAYMVTVTATDPSGLSATVNVTIKITDILEAPVLEGMASVRHAENTPSATAVATYIAMDDEDDKAGTAIRWSLTGANNGDFSITGGVLRFKSAPNYEPEAASTYNITVVATDSDVQTDDMDVTVTVTNVDEAGTLTLSTLQPVDGIQLTTTLTDIDGDTSDLTWKWAKSSSKTGAYTDIEGETLSSYTPKPADVGHYLRATETYTDLQGSGKTAVATTANKVLVRRSTNTAPVFKNADGVEIPAETVISREVVENTPKGGPVGAPVAATDSEGDVLTYTLVGDELSSFSIDVATGQLRTSAALDFESMPTYTVMVTATDPSFTAAADSDTIMVTINVTNVDEDPKLTGPASARVAENTDITEPIATTAYAATDDEDGVGDGAVVMTLSGADADVFSIDGGIVKFKAVPNFEAPKDAGKDNVYNITVVATDSDVQTDEMDVTVTVTNVDEGGTVTLSTLQPRIGTALTATLTDIDGAVSDVKWQWAKSDNGVGDSYTDIAEATASSYTPVAADDGAFLRATARYTDPQGSGKTAVSNPQEEGFSAVEIDDTNRAPEFLDQDLKMDGDQTDQDREIEENTGAGMDVGDGLTGTVPVTATDPNDDNLTYTLGGTDGASFSIDRNTGQLQTKAALNREEKDAYMVTVTATDPSGLFATVNVTIKITDMPEPPVIMRAPDANVAPVFASATTSRTVAENTVADEDIGDPVMGTDANGDTLAYALGGTDAASFDIDPETGQLMTLAALDYETKATYEVMVTATDPDSASDMITVTITVTNVDEMGEVTLWAGTDALTMAPQVGDTITGAVMDPDGGVTGETWQWSKTMDTADMSSWMDIQDATAAAYMVTEGDTGYHLRVMATYTDAAGTDMAMEYSPPTMMVTAMMTVPMFDSETATREVAENTEAGMHIGDPVMGTDADGDTLAYTLGGTDAASFDIDPETGQLMTLAALDYETKATYEVMVTATDPDSASDMITVTITVTNVDEMGEVTLWAGTDALTMAPQVGDTITGAVMDPDGGVTGETWQWSKTMDTADMSSWMDIQDATAAAYMVTEGDTGYHLRVMATYTDAAGTDMAMEYSPPTMMVTAMMTVPMFDSETATREVAENTEAGMHIGDPVMGTDADGDTLAYALGGTDAASFDIDPETGQLETLAALDYETKATYEVMVTATDPDSASDMITVTITVTNVDEMGEVTLWAGTDALTMAPQVGDTITGAVMDPDGGVTGETWQWARTKTPDMMESWMDIQDATAAAYMVTEGDTGYHLRVMATYTDAAGTDMAMRDVVVTVTDVVEETPIIGGTLLERFDTDVNGEIDKSEVIMAINDYLDEIEGVTKKDVLDVINLYLDTANPTT